MKLQTQLSLAFAGLVGVAALAGCPNGIPTPTPTATAPTSPAPTATPNTQRVYFQQMMFTTAAGTNQGLDSVTLKNGSSSNVTLSNYMLGYNPSGTGATATSSIVDASGSAIATLSPGATLSVYLTSAANLAGTTGTAMTNFPDNSVQYGKGGGLALFSSKATTSANIVDFVQWGITNTLYEAVADQANLWTPNTTVATVSVGTTGLYLNPMTVGATGSANWKFTAF